MDVVIFAVLLGLIPAYVAAGKGRKFWKWWLYGALLFLPAVIHVILIKPNGAEPEG